MTRNPFTPVMLAFRSLNFHWKILEPCMKNKLYSINEENPQENYCGNMIAFLLLVSHFTNETR